MQETKRHRPTPIARESQTRPASSGAVYLLPVSSATILLTLNQLAVMSQNGVELAEALDHVTANCKDARLQRTLQSISAAVSSGSTFSAAVSTYGEHFPNTLPAMIAAAEATGEVPETLGRVCNRMRGELELRGAIIGALIYPAILIAASIVVMTALVLGVLPQFGRVFESMGRDVPTTTQILIDLGVFGRTYWLYMLPVVIAAAIAAVILRRHTFVQAPLGHFALYGPWVKGAFRPLMAGRVFRTISVMVGGGVPLLQAVRLTKRTVINRSWFQLLCQMEDNLIDGRPASVAMHQADFLPSEAAQMMATGERTGRVSEVLEDIGMFYEQEGGRRIKRLVVALEPVIILIMGVVVAGVVMSVMLPLLDVSTVQR